MPLLLLHGLEMEVGLIELVGSEIIDIEPIIIPGCRLGLLHLLLQLLIRKLGIVAEADIVAALNNGLTFAEYCKMTVEAVPHSELLSGADHIEVFTISDEDTRLTCPNKDITILAFIDVHAGCCVE